MWVFGWECIYERGEEPFFGSIGRVSMWVFDGSSSEGVWYVVTSSRAAGYVDSTPSSVLVDGLSVKTGSIVRVY